MKESRFLELLNLYIDQEISPEEAALLEQEIVRSAQRRKVYVQYCRMHRASSILFERYRADSAPSGDTLAQAARDVDQKVLQFPQVAKSRSLKTWGYAMGSVAAAACLALVIVNRDAGSIDMNATNTQPPRISGRLDDQSAPSNVASSGAIQAKTSASPSGVVTPVATAPAYQSAFVVRALGQSATPSLEGNEMQQGTSQLAWDWMNRVQISPVQIVPAADLLFENRPALQQDPRTFRSLRPVPANFEMTAFQFQK